MSVLEDGFLRRRRVRLVRQTEVAECGLACIAMIAGYHGLKVDLASLRKQFSPSLRGMTLRSLMGIADQIGLTPRAVKLDLEGLAKLPMPAMLHWGFNHFVVADKVQGRRVRLLNPDGRSGWYSFAEVSKFFTGVALELRPSQDFRPGDLRVRLRLPQLWERISGLGRMLAQVFLLSLVLQAFVIASPYYLQIAIDSALPALDLSLLALLAVGFGLFSAINAVASWLRGFVILSAGTSVGFSLASNVARRLFRLPVDWFERRHVGDILSRFQSITPIQTLLAEGAVVALIDGLLALLTLVLMYFYSPMLASITLMAFILYALVRIGTFGAQEQAQEESIVTRGIEQTFLIESLRGINTLRLFNRETLRHAVWQSRLTDSMNAMIQLGRLTTWQTSANMFIFGLENILTIYFAVSFVIDGGFSVGMVFAYLAYKTQFLDKASSLITQAVSFRMLRLHLDRLSDIALANEDISFGENALHTSELRGALELRNVSYRYSASEPLVLDNVSFKVEPGEHVAITGPSGGGKSTLVKIMLGLVQPDTGEVLVDGMPIERFGYKSYHEQVGAVLQEDSLFFGSLGDNISLFDDAPDQDRIEEAAKSAAIFNDINEMPTRFQTLVGDMGSALSGGQKQRLLLARAIYRRPSLLIMDEGTSHLDAAHERMVNTSIDSLGITRIIIAHRKETIAAADRVLTVVRGRMSDVTEQQGDEMGRIIA